MNVCQLLVGILLEKKYIIFDIEIVCNKGLEFIELDLFGLFSFIGGRRGLGHWGKVI